MLLSHVFLLRCLNGVRVFCRVSSQLVLRNVSIDGEGDGGPYGSVGATMREWDAVRIFKRRVPPPFIDFAIRAAAFA